MPRISKRSQSAVIVCALALLAVGATADTLAGWQSGFDKVVEDFKLQPSADSLGKLSSHVNELGDLKASFADKLALLRVYASAKRDLATLKATYLKGGDVLGQLDALHTAIDTKLSHIADKTPIYTEKPPIFTKPDVVFPGKDDKLGSFRCKLAAVFGKSLPGCGTPGASPPPLPVPSQPPPPDGSGGGEGEFAPPPPPGFY